MTNLAALIDHTILAPDATTNQVLKFCEQAKAQLFHAVCVNPAHVRRVADALAGSPVKTCAVIGFPLGANTPAIKAAEAARALSDGATEIDMVLAIGALKDGQTDTVDNDIAAVRAACPGAILKTILETCLLTDEEKRLACRIAQTAGADYVKTSTGFSRHGATTADVALMRQTVGPTMGVKASGGIRTREAAEAMIAAGATRLGTSSGLSIIGQSKAITEAY
jgi:deoxyribose-phosphate aldolase